MQLKETPTCRRCVIPAEIQMLFNIEKRDVETKDIKQTHHLPGTRKMHLRLSFLTAAGLLASASATDATKQPNFVFILTDDQDTHMNSLDHMPFVQKHLLFEGTHFPRHYCTMALCCPSRVSLLTGMAAHNTNVTDIWPPYGGYPKFVDEGHNEAYLPIFLQEAGYNTYYSGKLFNAHSLENYNNPPAGGWTESEFLLDPREFARGSGF